MTNADVLRLNDGLKAVKDLRKKDDSSFAYAVGRNIRNLAPIADSIIGTLTVPESYEQYQAEYNTKRVGLCELYAEKDKDDKPIKEGTGRERKYKITDRRGFDQAIEVLQEELNAKYQVTFREMKENHKQYEAFLDMECMEDIKLICVKEDQLPEGITGEEVSNILEMIEQI